MKKLLFATALNLLPFSPAMALQVIIDEVEAPQDFIDDGAVVQIRGGDPRGEKKYGDPKKILPEGKYTDLHPFNTVDPKTVVFHSGVKSLTIFLRNGVIRSASSTLNTAEIIDGHSYKVLLSDYQPGPEDKEGKHKNGTISMKIVDLEEQH